MTIPNLFVSFTSSREVFNKAIAFVRCSPEPRLNHFKDNKYIPVLVGVAAFILSILSPLAGCYITYTTLRDKGIDRVVTVMATTTILMARFCFANFTSRGLLT